MKESTESSQSNEAPLLKPDTSDNLTRYEIWFQDSAQPNLWHSRAGDVLDTTEQGDFYHDVLQMVQVVLPLKIDCW